jgi:hypothetical protein
LKFLHITNWNLSQLKIGNVYQTPKDHSYYWEGKINGQRYVTPQNLPTIKFGDFNLLEDYKFRAELLKEHIFEDIRLNEYSDLPSRKRCMFLLDPQEDAISFCTQYGFNKPPYYVIEIEKVDGKDKTHRCQISLLDCDTRPYSEIVENARKYWSGTDKIKSDMEILFEGGFIVTKVLHRFSS